MPPPPSPVAAKQFLNFVNASPSPFHAVHEAKLLLVAAGYAELKEKEHWNVKRGGKFFFTRNQSTLVAFAVGRKYSPGSGFSIVGAHTDSPCLRVKPVSALTKSGFLSVGVECYGGGLWDTWFDRDLTVAGRVILKDKVGDLQHKLVHVKRPILRVPNLAIHLRKPEERQKWNPNKESELVPVLATVLKGQLEGAADASSAASNEQSSKRKKADAAEASTEKPKHHPLLLEIICEELGCAASDIVDFELCLADTQDAVIGGAKSEFIFSPRLDNLHSSFCCLKGLIETSTKASLDKETHIRMIALFDHEEVGSSSAQGAGSSIVEYTIRRLAADTENEEKKSSVFEEAIPRSMLVSADMAHGLHPNYPSRHEDNHRPAMHMGPVIKFNANQRYATNAVTAAILRQCAEKVGVPLQDFVVRNDSPCGSTIGPILSANLGMRTIDIGNPQLSMHSIREMCCVSGVEQAIHLFKGFFENFPIIDQKLSVD